MSFRTTATAVEGIIEVDSSIDLTPFIEIANSLVTELCAAPVTGVVPYDAARLELIERWLSAHFYAVRDQRTEYERVDVLAQKVQTKVDLGLAVTIYGQQAMGIDTHGRLALLNQQIQTGKHVHLRIKWLGKKSPIRFRSGEPG